MYVNISFRIEVASMLELRQYKERIRFCEKHVCFEIAVLFPLPFR